MNCERDPRTDGPAGGARTPAPLVVLAVALAFGGCASNGGSSSGKVLVTRGAYQLLQENHEATAVYADKAAKAPWAELVCEPIMIGKQRRTLCHARTEEAARASDHEEKWRELTTLPGAGG